MSPPSKPWKAKYAKSARSSYKQTSGSTCWRCNQKIMKEEVRISTTPESQGAKGLTWYHVNCYMEMSPTTQVEKLSGWDSLSASDQAAVSGLVKKVPSITNYVEPQEDKEPLQQSTSKGDAKRKRALSGDQWSKFSKTESDALSKENATKLEVDDSKASDFQSKLEAQTKELRDLKHDLKTHVTKEELQRMLEANNQDSTGKKRDLRDRCAHGMFFGALYKCPFCSGCLRYSGGMYRCHGSLSACSKCSYSAPAPDRVKGKWEIPEETTNQYLCKWSKSQKAEKPVRISPPPSSSTPSGSQAANVLSQSSKGEQLGDVKVAIAGVSKESMEEWKSKIEEAGSQVHTKFRQDTDCLVVRGVMNDQDVEMRKARRMKLPIFRADYLDDCVKRQKKLPFFFQKQPGRFFPLDIDYGVNKESSKEKNLNEEKSQLAPPLVELMKMLFNVETYRTAMKECEIDMFKMPFGQLSKNSIKKGFEALTEIQNLLNSNEHDLSIKERQIADASKIFFIVIPSINSNVVWDEDKVKSKVRMLEVLQGIEIASRLVGFNADNDDSFDEKYKKLCCDIAPLLPDSEDYMLIKKYLQTTHAATHPDWSFELEAAFSLEREGEFDKFAPCQEKLSNRMLLWHGSRLTNFVGILSQGLRIAPPEAPATAYMFGKGVYFADVVSKSAQYCYFSQKNPVGLMLLSEVALGEVYELTEAKYMDKPPEGKHSTKGLGRKVPQESKYLKWKDEVIVPCGKPVSSNIESELMYNKYIVYDTAQVKMKFLLKVRFQHKTTGVVENMSRKEDDKCGSSEIYDKRTQTGESVDLIQWRF